jgi:hypothetical protein
MKSDYLTELKKFKNNINKSVHTMLENEDYDNPSYDVLISYAGNTITLKNSSYVFSNLENIITKEIEECELEELQ